MNEKKVIETRNRKQRNLIEEYKSLFYRSGDQYVVQRFG